ncbi:polysaccharide biosynthesis/export family protein [Pararhodobacter zhoushanensis]|uniref:Polysaccharide biosynthesis/export family protein n=1 Tax=Pararhodobacter zhoushanensis TaxID=2479545 RepID=A0ABT3GWB3_9RHOB|nr:polysaccharide biosynthesis/export family protein [Pararhodobacter zhoushanensis]MCW1931823.1 polysaccharide biosynthesis/export family protein [Pararhodobacter zhoushanensis]
MTYLFPNDPPVQIASAMTAPRRIEAKRALAVLLCATLGLAGCSDSYLRFPVSADAQRALTEQVDIIHLNASNIASFSEPTRGYAGTALPSGRGWNYLVGTGDILSVIVFDHPELTLPEGENRSSAESGFRVQSDGTINYPFVGAVTARGRPPEQIRDDLTQRLSRFIPDPQVDVRVAAFNSQGVVVSGEVSAPNRQALTTVPLTLIEAINAAGGASDTADLRAVTVQRSGQVYPVDVQGFLRAGIVQNNPVLRNGDVVSVPRRLAQEAYLLGEVARPDAIDLSLEPVTLTQAVTRLGGLAAPRADMRGIFVFRMTEARPRVFQLDTSSPTGLLLGTRFVLEPGDVVYVVRSPLQRWNDTITRLLPSVRAIDAIDTITN